MLTMDINPSSNSIPFLLFLQEMDKQEKEEQARKEQEYRKDSNQWNDENEI